MTPHAKIQSALVALARSRRLQRALAHAYLHRGAPMPTLRSSLGFMMQTTSITEEVSRAGHHMTVLGLSIAEHIIYVVEELGPNDSPVVYRLFLRGPRIGHCVPMYAWYEQCDDAAGIRAKIAELIPTLLPLSPATAEAWMLSTRIVQRRAVRVAGQDAPIRKFALQLAIEAVSGHGASGKTTVTAFLRAQASLVEVLAIPNSAAVVARVTYTGIPSGLGLGKDTVVLLTPTES